MPPTTLGYLVRMIFGQVHAFSQNITTAMGDVLLEPMALVAVVVVVMFVVSFHNHHPHSPVHHHR